MSNPLLLYTGTDRELITEAAAAAGGGGGRVQRQELHLHAAELGAELESLLQRSLSLTQRRLHLPVAQVMRIDLEQYSIVPLLEPQQPLLRLLQRLADAPDPVGHHLLPVPFLEHHQAE